MPPYVQLEDENGKALARASCGWPFAFLIGAADLDRTKCLCFIDETGDTVFNRLQAPVLAQELEAAAARVSDRTVASQYSRWREGILRAVPNADFKGYEPPSPTAVQACAQELSALARRCEDEVHTYLKFYGD